MRQIKFRAWDKGHNKMSYDVNLYSLGSGVEMNKAQIDNQQVMKTIGFACEVMQYTGLKDKNDKDIYEGDVLNFIFDGVVFIKNTYCVIFECGAFVINKPNFHPLVSDCISVEIIGNIYENPELLNSDKNDERSVATGDAGSNTDG